MQFRIVQALVFSARDGTFKRTIGRKGNGPGEYTTPRCVVVLPARTPAGARGPLRRWRSRVAGSSDPRPAQAVAVRPSKPRRRPMVPNPKPKPKTVSMALRAVGTRGRA